MATAQQLSDLAVGLVKEGHSVTVITGDRGYDDPSQRFARRETWHGIKIARIKDSSRTVLFLDAAMQYQVRWHPRSKGNVCYVDGHVAFQDFPSPKMALWK